MHYTETVQFGVNIIAYKEKDGSESAGCIFSYLATYQNEHFFCSLLWQILEPISWADELRTTSGSSLTGFYSKRFSRQNRNHSSPNSDYKPSTGLPSHSQFCASSKDEFLIFAWFVHSMKD